MENSYFSGLLGEFSKILLTWQDSLNVGRVLVKTAQAEPKLNKGLFFHILRREAATIVGGQVSGHLKEFDNVEFS